MTIQPADDSATQPTPAASLAALPITVRTRRSGRRKRTVKWTMQVQTSQVLVEIECPAGIGALEEISWRDRIVARVKARLARLSRQDDSALNSRARALARTYFGRDLPLTSAAWSDRQQQRWGSCTSQAGAIRLSSRLRSLPNWVTDYVIIHELAHLIVPDHSPRFWDFVRRYPLSERARGFLAGYDYHIDPAAPADDDV